MIRTITCLGGILFCFGAFEARAADDCVFWVRGLCFDCYTTETLGVGTPENCLKHCPNRVVSLDQEYISCNLRIKNNHSKNKYQNAEVPKDNYLKENYFEDDRGEYYPCNTTAVVRISYECEQDKECRNRCPNRTIRYNGVTSRYSVIKCPENRPLMDWRLMCWSCDEETPINMSFGQHLNEQFCQGKRYLGGLGYISYKCPQDKQKLKEDECRQCNGKWKNGKCR